MLKRLEVSEQTYYRWRKRYGELSPDDARRLRELEGENARLKKLVADQALDIDMLKEISRGNFEPRAAPAGRCHVYTRSGIGCCVPSDLLGPCFASLD